MGEPDPDNRTEKAKHWREIASKTGKCALCPPHWAENVTRSRRGVRKPRWRNRKRRAGMLPGEGET